VAIADRRAGASDATLADTRLATLAGSTDLEGFRRLARRLVLEGVAPEGVRWKVADDGGPTELDGDRAADESHREAAAVALFAPPLQVPRRFAEQATEAILHRDPGRFELLYRVLWRLQREPGLRHDRLDPDWLALERLAHAVHREMHRTKAFVRFRPVDRGPGEPRLHVAWFEPEHHVVEAVAPFFTARFASLRWTLLTPLASLAWDGSRLRVGPGASRDDAPPPDADERLWLTYYENVFNPARLKLASLRRQMPQRYWKNLPEAALIPPLALHAEERSAAMIDRRPTERARGGRWTAPVYARPSAEPLPERGTAVDDAIAREAVLAATRRAAAACARCPLHAPATQVVFGEGPVDAPVCFVGEQPGDREDLAGRPFVGPSGALFDRALATLGIARDSVYVTNAVKHFKFELRGHRRIHKSPAQQEAAACLDWLEREIELVRPQALVALGATAARALLGRDVGVLRERGRWIDRADGRRVLVTLHPSALLRLPGEEHEAAIARWLEDLAPLAVTPAQTTATSTAPRPLTSKR
jgi:uracil-DNA glycosylase